MNPPTKKMVQRIFNPSQFRQTNGLTTLSKENFARVMTESLHKAISSNETAVKEKHVRKLLIGSFQAESGEFFWKYLPTIKLKENQIICWKFCHVLHKMLRDGHYQVVLASYERRQILLDCGNMWRHVPNGYGQLIYKYCSLLFNRIIFLRRNPRFPNDLKLTDAQLDEVGEHDNSIFFDLSCELFDALDDILRLQELVLCTVDLKRLSSMSSEGQCHLGPLVACIQDSSLFYDYLVKILFKLHANLPADVLGGHRDRFLCHHKALKSFYSTTSNLQYFRTLIQIPVLTERPPNFLVSTDLQQHVTPQVVIISSPERDSPDSTCPSSSSRTADHQHMLVSLNDDDVVIGQNESSSFASIASSGDTPQPGSISLDSLLKDDFKAIKERNEELVALVARLQEDLSRLENEVETEKACHASSREELTNQLERARNALSQQEAASKAEVKKAKDELSNMKHEMIANKKNMAKLEEDVKRAESQNGISQIALKKIVKDLNDLKISTSASQKTAAIASVIDEKQVNALKTRVDELTLQLKQRDSDIELRDKERDILRSERAEAERLLTTKQEDLLMAEMNETDKIIKEATRKIEELNEKSRQSETGIKLQVNEKISEVCTNLMKAVRSLIIQSRLLQREVVGTEDGNKVSEFYQRNSAWTEGLISAANVVAMAARSLVDAADRSMSGQAKFSELAAAAHEVAAATTQLVVASRVKANKDSSKLEILVNVARQVSQCTGQVVDTARVCGELVEQEADKVDISSLSLHQTKKLEMETQVRLLELEDELSKQRIKLGLLRKRHYEQEDAQQNQSSSTSNK